MLAAEKGNIFTLLFHHSRMSIGEMVKDTVLLLEASDVYENLPDLNSFKLVFMSELVEEASAVDSDIHQKISQYGILLSSLLNSLGRLVC